MGFGMKTGGRTQAEQDRDRLRKLGYIQELERNVGVFSNFALSFSVISILTGLITLYGFSSVGKGDYEFWSWLIVGLFQLVMALSLGEIASCYPIEGGIYAWTNILGNRTVGWFNGWISLIGWLACTTGINFGLSEFVLEFFSVEATMGSVFSVCFIVVFMQCLISFFGIRTITKINNISVILHIVGVLAISILLLTFSGNPIDWQRLSLRHAIDNFKLVYYIPTLLMTAWTLTAFDSSANISEECINPTRTVPFGMILSVAVSILCGALLLFSFGQNNSILETAGAGGGRGSLQIIAMILGPTLTTFLSLILISAMFSCGLASQTATVRVIFAFSRNNGLPFSEIWKKVPSNFSTPIFCILLCSVVELLISFMVSISLVNHGAGILPLRTLPIITALSTVGIYMSYAVVMALAIFKRHKIRNDRGSFYLGRYGLVLNVIAFVWAASVTMIMLTMYDLGIGIIFSVAALILVVYYFLSMRRVLKYNNKQLTESELLDIENMRGID